MTDSETRRKVLRDPVHFLAFGFGTGLAPVAPGTFGSLPGVLFAWLSLPLPVEWRILLGVALILSGIWLCGESARRIGVHEHSGIVWD
jgi:phosphatidylglycerophosphatase A